MPIMPRNEEHLSPTTEAIHQLLKILCHDFTTDLSSSLATLPAHSSLRFKINAEICIHSPDTQETEGAHGPQIHLGSIDLCQSELQQYLRDQSTGHVSTTAVSNCVDMESGRTSIRCEDTVSSIAQNQPSNVGTSPARTHVSEDHLHDSGSHLYKRRKTTGGLRVRQVSTVERSDNYVTPASTGSSTARQLQTKSREFPQRKKKNDEGVHHLQPSSIEKFVAGVWKQMFSSVELTPVSLDNPYDATIVGSGCNIEAFRAINSLCLRVTRMSRCSRALETIIQAHWVDCFEARVKAIGVEQPFLSNTETKMAALREACTVLQWSEKELRNKLSIWRGYKEIKDAGGWASLVFAGSGIYRFCKYRVGFGENLATRLERLQPSLEVAADTIHPEWRRLLSIIGQESQILYPGHPHDWVVCDVGKPIPLRSTYTQWFPDFQFTHLDDSVLDQVEWGTDDPRCMSSTRATLCNTCGHFQSNNFSCNECRCFPELYGACKTPIPIQVFRTPLGKNNGLIARCEFPRGSAIGEFIGLITKGMDGTDVMQSGDNEKRYQIYQGKLGNYTRFINHSCAPNSQFQKFCWLGSERIILVSRGVEAGAEITVDYSNEYWEGLDKECLCGESCCRYLKKKAQPTAVAISFR
ncbi:hypothetical protein BJ875DRAFT_110849 [Amylocarpus encephaloides]|uniref:SET domain-containing protein n=1 Tax=Amylocarpus encephaloides TaxID=45428 RepID=A0A9P7YDI1_9HELO|nr:hypothetical protein BJ875DRAFT_110849 [Amylocarpus encephaloides]